MDLIWEKEYLVFTFNSASVVLGDGGVGVLRVKICIHGVFGTVNDGIVVVTWYSANESMILNDSTV